jgi:glutaredoxin 3
VVKGGTMAKKVTVYGTTMCPFCVRVKQFLKESNIQFTDVDVSMNSDKADEMIKKSGQMGVPVIEIDEEIIVGFDKEKIKQKLGL